MLTEYKNICAVCGAQAECTHHLVFGKGIRNLAEADKLTIPLCNSCHNMGKYRIHDNPISEQLSKMLGQTQWEYESLTTDSDRKKAREAFRKRYGKSYL